MKNFCLALLFSLFSLFPLLSFADSSPPASASSPVLMQKKSPSFSAKLDAWAERKRCLSQLHQTHVAVSPVRRLCQASNTQVTT